uniref:Uncharacterized protein n=1 Tax=Arion vulgaris TaxID=1028688 RepID=A0A0B6ZEV0_9EUPU
MTITTATIRETVNLFMAVSCPKYCKGRSVAQTVSSLSSVTSICEHLRRKQHFIHIITTLSLYQLSDTLIPDGHTRTSFNSHGHTDAHTYTYARTHECMVARTLTHTRTHTHTDLTSAFISAHHHIDSDDFVKEED